ncbi:DUF305 domain-containing protein [Isoptericola jiangsuensis]|nr:DUF305 domain-containing protein [Isoptericola jiangsuensis]
MTHTLMRRALAPVVALAVVGALAACSDTEPSGPGTRAAASSQDSAAFNMADVMFAQMMIPHHEQAIEMSDVLLGKDGIDPEVVDLAEQIKQAQGPEIETMSGWLDEWDMGMDGAGHDAVHGMMSGSDMESLEEADGAQAQTLFLEQMIVHHEGAVDMAADEVDDGRFPATVEMAQTIVETQTDEIRFMEDLLAAE